MDATRDYHMKSDREIHDITYMWILKYGTNEPISKQKQTHRHREQTCGCQGSRGLGGMDWSSGLVDANYYI